MLTCRICWVLLACSTAMACNDPVRPRDNELPIEGYTVSGQASGTDPATSEDLSCSFLMELRFDNGQPLIGSWIDTVSIRVTRARIAPSQLVTYDTIFAGQEVALTVPDSTHIQVAVTGPFTENLSGDMVSAYPGYGGGDWTCGPDHPLSRVQPDAALPGQFHIAPIINIPFE